MDKIHHTRSFALASLAGAAAMVASGMMFTDFPNSLASGRGEGGEFRRKTKSADPAKKAARKRQKAARAKNRKGK